MDEIPGSRGETITQILASERIVKVLLEAVTLKLELWPGGDPAEQEELRYLKNTLFAASMDLLLDRS
jgi:hypothetical protein